MFAPLSEEDVVLHLSGYNEDSLSHLRPEDLRLHIPQDKTVRIHFPESLKNDSDVASSNNETEADEVSHLLQTFKPMKNETTEKETPVTILAKQFTPQPGEKNTITTDDSSSTTSGNVHIWLDSGEQPIDNFSLTSDTNILPNRVGNYLLGQSKTVEVETPVEPMEEDTISTESFSSTEEDTIKVRSPNSLSDWQDYLLGENETTEEEAHRAKSPEFLTTRHSEESYPTQMDLYTKQQILDDFQVYLVYLF